MEHHRDLPTWHYGHPSSVTEVPDELRGCVTSIVPAGPGEIVAAEFK